MRTIIIILLAGLLAPISLYAQPLADQIPADAIFYVGWRGSEAMGPAYDASHLKAVIDSSDLPKLFSDFLPLVLQKVGQEDQKAQEVLSLVSSIGLPMFRRPSALYFAGWDLANPRQPVVRLALLCDAGPEAKSLADQLAKAIETVGPTPIPITVKTKANLVALIIGQTPALDNLLATPTPAAQPTLARHPEFIKAIAQVQKDSVLAVYLDCQALLRLVDDAIVAADAPPEAAAMWPKVRDAAGLTGLKSLVATAAFDGKDWATQAFIAAPAPRTGLLAMLDAKPLPDETLKTIPKSALLAVAGPFDTAKLFAQIHTALGNIDPAINTQFEQALEQGQQIVGLDLEKDLLQPLPETWALYVDPLTGGSSFLGSVLVGRLRDPAKAEQSLLRLEQFTNGILAAQMRDETPLRIHQTVADGLTIHYLGIPIVAPGWAIKNGNLYIALYPQILAAASNHVATNAPSLLDNPSFQAVRKRLGTQKSTSVSFTDLPQLFPTVYSNWLLLARFVGFADMFGLQSPPMLLPPMYKILPHLSPAGSASWIDDAGLHMRSISSFPTANALAGDPASFSMATAPAMVAILLPSLSRARETANRVKCGANMRQIGMAMLLYSNENKGRYPDNLDLLITTQDIGPQPFVCPSGHGQLPAEIRSATPDKQGGWVNANTSYVYLGKGLTTASAGPETILLYEKDENHRREGMNMLFGDTHVEFVPMSQAKKMIVDQQAAKAQPAP